MNIISVFIYVSLLSWMCFLAYFAYRTHKVSKLRLLVVELSSAYWNEQIEKYSRYDGLTQYDELPPFNKMVYSFKPIKLKNYLSEKTLKELEPYF